MTEPEAIIYLQDLITDRCIKTEGDFEVTFSADKRVHCRWHINRLPYWDRTTFKNMEEFINWLKQDL